VHKCEHAAKYSSLVIDMAFGRLLWNPRNSSGMRLLVCFVIDLLPSSLGEHVASLEDPEAVCELKTPWPNGHIRKSKALKSIGLLEEALEAIKMGLMYDRNDNECNLLVKEGFECGEVVVGEARGLDVVCIDKGANL